MAKTQDEDVKRPKSKVMEIAVWGLMALLILGLGGFGVTNFAGRITSIGSVGEVEIPADEYARALQARVAAFGEQFGQKISVQDAMAFGVDKAVLKEVVTRAALDNEAARLGLSVGDEVVATQIMSEDAFKGASGSFDREAYRFVLDRERLNEAEYEANLRRDISRQLLQGAVAGGFAAPKPLTDTIHTWTGERRGFSMLRLGESELITPLAEPTEAELKAHYDAHIDRFTKPEAKRITYASLLPEAIAKDQPVDEKVLKQLYQDRIEEFVIPERRIVERIVYPDQAAADAAKAKLDAGTLFEQLVIEHGLTMEAVDLGDIEREDLGAAADAVFGTTEGSVVGPLASDIGPALFRVVTILAGEETTFDQARETLAIEIQTGAARRLIEGKVELVDDLLGQGVPLEDLQKEAGLVIATLDHVAGQQGEAVIEGYPAFRDAADAVTADSFPETIILDDGGLVALRLDEVVPAAPIPFDEAKEKVTDDWRAEALTAALSTRAIEIAEAIEGGAPIGSFGIVDVTPETSRDGFVADAPQSLMAQVFKQAEGDVEVVKEGAFIAVIRLDSIQPAATEGEEAEATRAAIDAQAQQAIAADAFDAFTAALIAEVGVRLDDAAINAVNTSLP
jgi:peptidyl-prolyl cis-trans isomerase D